MKQIISAILIILVVGCQEKPLDVDKAKQVVEKLMDLTDREAWDEIGELYTAEFNASEPVEIKQQKLMRLKDTLGPVQSKEFISSTDVAEFGQPRSVILKYKVVHKRVTTVETFTVREDEGGYKIASHSVETEPAK